MKQKTIHNLNKHPRGSTILEFLTAGVLLATVVSFLAPFVSRISIVNETIASRELALREAEAIVTQLQQGEVAPTLSTAAKSNLDSATLEISESLDEASQLQQTTVSISWTNQFGEPHPPVTLSFWQLLEVSE